MTAPIIPGAEPWSSPEGGPHGVLVLHGFTGNPHSMRGLAHAFADAGFAVELPLLPGHGTSVEDMLETGWPDWSAAAEAALARLAGRADKIVVAGLSMGGALTAWLAGRHPELAGAVFINALVQAPDGMADFVQGLIDGGDTLMGGIGSDIADPDVSELSYAETPLVPLASLFGIGDEVQAGLATVEFPVLIITSRQDHVVPPENSDTIAALVKGPQERIMLERSFHVATLDHDKDLIEEAAVAFALKVTA
ncbi:MAG TPA: alpha/beta fold hydrolase [Acidimicrobiales bacterium]